jgi:hypothetical protein
MPASRSFKRPAKRSRHTTGTGTHQRICHVSRLSAWVAAWDQSS